MNTKSEDWEPPATWSCVHGIVLQQPFVHTAHVYGLLPMACHSSAVRAGFGGSDHDQREGNTNGK